MADMAFSGIIESTNSVPTVAPLKEETNMMGATNKKITALYCRLSQEDERQGESLSMLLRTIMIPQIPPVSTMTSPESKISSTNSMPGIPAGRSVPSTKPRENEVSR